MNTTFLKKPIVWICLLIVAILLVAGYNQFFAGSSDNQVTNKISVAEAQKIVDGTLGSIAKNTAKGAKYILDNTHITVNNVEYGNNKDVILSCTYTSLDVKGALGENVSTIMEGVYSFYMENENAGKKTNATKIALKVNEEIHGYLDSAQQVTGDITLHIYEISGSMKLYLDDELVDTVTGGLITVVKAINDTTVVEYNGETIDIVNKNTLRTGIKDCLALENYSFTRPENGKASNNTWISFKNEFYRNFVEKDRWMYLAQGLGTTLSITALAALMGILLGFIVALIRCTNQMTGKLYLLDKITQVYLTITRGTPVMVQLLILYFVCLLPLNVDKFIAAVLCFGLNSGAYVAEIVRGGIMSIDKGQIEAGRSLGFTYVQTMINFVIPQAFKAILPSLANEFITLLKESSVAFYIGVADLTQGGLKIRSITYSNFMPLIAIALIYLVLVMIMTKLVSILERRLAKSDH